MSYDIRTQRVMAESKSDSEDSDTDSSIDSDKKTQRHETSTIKCITLPNNSSALKYKVVGLRSSQKYIIELRAQNKTGWSDWSEPVHFKTKATKKLRFVVSQQTGIKLKTDNTVVFKNCYTSTRIFSDCEFVASKLKNLPIAITFVVEKIGSSGVSLGFVTKYDLQTKYGVIGPYGIKIFVNCKKLGVLKNGAKAKGEHIYLGSGVKNGDELTFVLNMKKRICDLIYNGKLCGRVFLIGEMESSVLIPAVANIGQCRSGSSVKVGPTVTIKRFSDFKNVRMSRRMKNARSESGFAAPYG